LYCHILLLDPHSMWRKTMVILWDGLWGLLHAFQNVTCHVYIPVKSVWSKYYDSFHRFLIMNRNDFSNLGLKHTIMTMTMIIIVQKKTSLITTSDVYYIYIYMWEIFLQLVSAKMGHCQVMHTVKNTKNYCIKSYLNLNKISFYNWPIYIEGN